MGKYPYMIERKKSVVVPSVLVILFVTVLLLYRQSIHTESRMAAAKLLHVDFEVFGRVQGVFFRKYTQQKAKSIGVRGWIRNTKQNTVHGELEGETSTIETMKNWLRNEGSPSSRIDRAVFRNEREIQEYTCNGFSVKH